MIINKIQKKFKYAYTSNCLFRGVLSSAVLLALLLGSPFKTYAVTTELSGDFSANELIVTAGDIFNTNGYEVDIGNKGINIYGKFDATDDVETDETYINTAEEFDVYLGAWFIPDQSTIEFDDNSGVDTFITAGTAPVYNIVVNSVSLTVEVQDPVVIENDLTITSGILDVVTSEHNQINIAGNWTGGGTFQAQNGTVVFDGTASVNLDSGCATAATCTNQDFYDVEIYKTSGTDANDNVSLLTTHFKVLNKVTITDGELVQGALDSYIAGSESIEVTREGKWTNVSTGNITLGGDVNNEGTMTFQGNGPTCPQTDDITIAAIGTTPIAWNGAGIFNVNDVNASYQGGERRILAYSSNDGGNNLSNWDFTLQCTAPEAMTNFDDLEIWGIQVD